MKYADIDSPSCVHFTHFMQITRESGLEKEAVLVVAAVSDNVQHSASHCRDMSLSFTTNPLLPTN